MKEFVKRNAPAKMHEFIQFLLPRTVN